MKAVNLETFYSVQPCSGRDRQVFKSYQEAQKTHDAWVNEVYADFERWKKGDRNVSDGIAQSRLEADVDGGCCQYFVVNDAALPSGIYTHEVGEELQDQWQDNKGAEKIRWGHLATARPRR
jgi:hypothetical protein